MYKIIGGDGKEYGPITGEQLRQWIAEGRANLQTRVLPDGATEWTTVAALPEFASTPPPPPGVMGTPAAFPTSTTASADAVNGPAIGLMCVAGIGFLLQVANLIFRFAAASMYERQQGNPFAALNSPMITIGASLLGIVMSVVILMGALKMKKLENHGFAMAASILAMIPCLSPCCLIGLPIGIWAVVVLSKPDVKNAFH